MAFSDQPLGWTVELPYWANQNFQLRVPGLICLTYGIIALVALTKLPDWLVLLAFLPYLVATVATYYRLKRHGRSGWWIVLMILHVGFGPSIAGIAIIGVVVNWIPVIVAWPEPRDA